MTEIVELITTATGWNGTLYGMDGNLATPYFVVKPSTGPESGKKYFQVIGHVDADTEKATYTNRNALTDFMEIDCKIALDRVKLTDRRGDVKQIYYLAGSLGTVFGSGTGGNDDGTISQESTYFYPENI